MKQFYLRLLMAAACLLATSNILAHDFVVNGIYYKITSTTNKTVAITYAFDDFDSFSNEYTGDVIIPESVTYNGTTYSVTSIGDGTFYKCTELTSITIPNNITSIGYSAFAYCTGLTNITIPNSVTSIGSSAFYNTAWYNDQPDGIVYAGKVLYKYKGTMPKNTSIVIEDGTLGIAGYAFSDCTGLTNIEIPNSVTNIGNEAFEGCNSIENIDIKDGTETLILGNGGYQAGPSYMRGLFSSQYNLKTLYLGRNLQYQVGYNYLDKYNYYAPFNDLKNLKNITIGNNVTDIGEDLFIGCTNISCVINFSNLRFSKGSKGYGYIAYHANRVVNAKNGFIEGEYVFTTNNTYFLAGYIGNDTIPTLPMYCKNEKYGIGGKAFADCNWITSINIPNSVTSIEESAFSGCTGLTNIEIPNSVTNIGNSAFSGCTGLTSIEIPNSVTNIGSSTFSGCTGLTSIEIPNSVTNIGSSAFENCTGLTSIVIGENVTSIENYAFGGCTALKNLHIKEGEGKLLLGYQYYGNPYTQTKGKGLFYDCPLETVFIGKELDFKRDYATGHTPFYFKNIDTITISKPQQMNLEFGNNSKHITLLFIDYNSYYRVIPTNLTQNSSLYYFNHPINNSNYKNATEYLKKSLNCKAKMVMLGDVQTDYHSISVALNDTLIIPENIALSTAPNNIIFRAVNINGENIIPDNDGKYLSSNLQIATEYPVILKYKYNDQKHTTSTTIRTKAIKPTSSSTTTLTTAKINFSEGDTIGLNSPINEIGVEFNGERYTAEKNYKELELKNLGPSSQYGYRVYCIIDSVIHYGDYMYFTTKTPSIAIANLTTTQTTANLKITGNYSDKYLSPTEIGVNVNGRYYVADDKFNVLVDGLTPSTTYILQPYVKYENYGIYYGTSNTITTSSITVDCNVTATTATTISLKGTHDVGDATLLENGFVDGEFNSENMTITGLDPDTEYSFTYYVTTEEGGRIEKQVTVRTEPLKFNTLKAKATSNTKAIICAEANIANEEAGTGFEWRRIDAPDLVPSELVGCAIHEGVMEGALHNLSANTYYKYRPYYCSATGNYYYGEWIGFGTADAYVYFTPTIHTYTSTKKDVNSVRLNGYVLAGSDNIKEQGFEYWPVGKVQAAPSRSGDSRNVTKVTASGQRMSAVIEDLEYGTVYACRAYVITESEIFYGEEITFETSYPTGIADVYEKEDEASIRVMGNTIVVSGHKPGDKVLVYTMHGAVIYNGTADEEITLESGMYIVNIGNTTKKVRIR